MNVSEEAQRLAGMSRSDALNLLVEHTPYGTEDADRTSCAVSAIMAAFELGQALPEDLAELIREARDNAYASLAETDISPMIRAYRVELVERLDAARSILCARAKVVGGAV